MSGGSAWRRLPLLAGAVALGLAAVIAYARTDLTVLSTQAAGDLRFVADPAHEGYETAVTVGDPSKPGVYAVQTRLPANTTILPHTHGEKWRVGTVLSGTLHYAQGEVFDETKLKSLPPGSVIVEPHGVVHFARTGNEPVLLNIVGEGPASTVPFRK